MTEPTMRRWWPKLPPAWIQLPVTPLKTALALLLYADDDTGTCWPSQDRLAADAGLSVRSIRQGIAYLRAAGLVTVRRRRQGTAVYILHLRHTAPVPTTPTYADIQAALADLEPEADTPVAGAVMEDRQNPAGQESRAAGLRHQERQDPAGRTSQEHPSSTTTTSIGHDGTGVSPMVTRLMQRIAGMPERMAIVEFFEQLPAGAEPDGWARLIFRSLTGTGFESGIEVQPHHVAAACLDMPIRVQKGDGDWTPGHFRKCVSYAAAQKKGAVWGGKAPAYTASAKERASAAAASEFVSGG